MRATRVKQDGAMTGPVFMAVHGTARRHGNAVKRESSEGIRGTQQLAQLQDIALRVEGDAHHKAGPRPLL